MRVAVVSPLPAALKHDKYAWVAEGVLDAGHECERVHGLPALRQADKSCELVLFCQYAGGLNPRDVADITATKRATWAVWWFDLLAVDASRQLAEQDHVQTYLPFLSAMDVAFVKERGMLGEYAALGVRAAWLDQCCWRGMPMASLSENPECDVLVAGRSTNERRWRDVALLVHAGFRVAWLGPSGGGRLPDGLAAVWPWVKPELMPAYAGRCKVALSVDARQDVDGYTSDRLHLLCGMGATTLHRRGCWAPDCRAFFYQSDDEMVSLCRALCDTTIQYRRANASGTRAVEMDRHTYGDRIGEIVACLSASCAT